MAPTIATMTMFVRIRPVGKPVMLKSRGFRLGAVGFPNRNDRAAPATSPIAAANRNV